MSVSPPASQRPGPPEAEDRAGLARVACPRCSLSVDGLPEACPHCGFSLDHCGSTFNFSPPNLQFTMDPEGRLPAKTLPALRTRREALRSAFPQIDLSFCLVSLAEGHDVRDFGFWLFNRAPAAADSRAWHLLVTADLHAGRLALTPGYAIEPFLQRDEWNAALASLAKRGGTGDWALGIADFIDRSRLLLEDAAARLAARPAPVDTPAPAAS